MERLVIVTGLVLSVICAPVPQDHDATKDLLFAKQFMSRFGYLQAGDSESGSLIRVDLAIKDVQKFGGIPQTGEIDNSTIQLMKSPRCGLPDIIHSNSTRRKRYIITSGWTKRRLTYFLANWSPKIGREAMKRELKVAFSAWAQYGRLIFQEVSTPAADIIVSFGSSYHGDPYPFDGPGNTLAHAFFPSDGGSISGDIHFDDDETWKVNPGEFEDGVDFFTVAVHEIGHSLGLSHSPEEGSVMNPYYRRFNSDTFNLGYDDILAMYELYITKPVEEGGNEFDDTDYNTSDDDRRTTATTRRPTTTTTTRKPTTRKTVMDRPTRTPTTTLRPYSTTKSFINFVGDDESVETHKSHDPTHHIPAPMNPIIPDHPVNTSSDKEPDACEGHFDAIAFLRGELFIFKDKYMWRLSKPGQVMPGYPVPFHRMFHKLPESLQRIDAAYERDTDSNLIFFSGDKYWVYNGNEVVDGSPRSISDYGLPRYVKHVDAVIVWAKNKKTYIFSGDRYWRFNESTHTMDSGYPKNMELFRGVPPNLDTAMTWSDGITYFFKNNWYWMFNSTWLKTEPFYPQIASQYWLGCR